MTDNVTGGEPDIIVLPDKDTCEKYFKKVQVRDDKLDVINDDSERFLHAISEVYDNGQYRLSETLLFIGTIRNGVPDGQGRIIDLKTKFCVYEGEVRNKVYNGRGRSYQSNILFEDGEFENGLIKCGIRYNSDRSLYNGEFLNNQPHGKGTVVFPNGFFYETNWSFGKPLGPFIIRYPDASNTTTLPSNHFFIKADYVEFIQNQIHYCLYSNGDVCMGTGQTSIENGFYYKYMDNQVIGPDFMKMQIGDGCPLEKQPVLTKINNEYITLSFVSCVWYIKQALY